MDVLNKAIIIFYFAILVLLPVGISAQCAPRDIEIKNRNDTFKILETYSERISFLTKCVDDLIKCEYFDDAATTTGAILYWSKKKGDKFFYHQLHHIRKLDSIRSQFANQLSDSVSLELSLKSLESWLRIHKEAKNHSKAIAQLNELEKYFELKRQYAHRNVSKLLRETCILGGQQYWAMSENERAISYFQKALHFNDWLSNGEEKIRSRSIILGYLLEAYQKMGNDEMVLIMLNQRYESVKKMVVSSELYSGNIFTSLRQLAEWHIQHLTLDSANYYIQEFEKISILLNREAMQVDFLKTKFSIANANFSDAEFYLNKIFNKYSNVKELVNIWTISDVLKLPPVLLALQDFIRSEKLLLALEKRINGELDSLLGKKRPDFHYLERKKLELILYQLSLPSGDSRIAIAKMRAADLLIRKGIQGADTISTIFQFARQSDKLTNLFLGKLEEKEKEFYSDIHFSIESSKAISSMDSWLKNQIFDLKSSENIFGDEWTCQEDIRELEYQNLVSNDSVQIALLEKKIEITYEKFDAIKELLKTQHPAYYQMKYDWQIPSLESVQKSLEDNQVFVNYFEGEEFLYALVLSNEASHFVKIDSAEHIRKWIDRYVQDILGETKNEELSYLLYQKLIYPLKDYLTDRIIISPSGSLHQLPFAALSTQPNSNSTDRFLIHNYAISITPSASFFYQQGQSKKDNIIRNALLVAPTFYEKERPKNLLASRSDLGVLKYNIPEIENAATYVRHHMLSGNKATKSAFLKDFESTDLIHLSTHAQANADAPDKSIIAFYAPPKDNQEDTSRLYLDDLSKLHLPAKLVVLSACETGLGKIFKGEGAMSLANGCFYAGAQSVMATLWSVRDRPTFDIVSNFYQHLDNGLPKDKALQLAQLDFLNDNSGEWSQPYFWAGFTIIGNSDAIEFKRNWSIWTKILIAGLVLGCFSFILFLRNRLS